MSSDGPSVLRPRGPNAGLCETCQHRQLVPNTRGSVFSLCTRSRIDPAYPRYPRLPVLSCPGYEENGSRASGEPGGEPAAKDAQ